MKISAALAAVAAKAPNHPAVIDARDGRVWTHAELHAHAATLDVPAKKRVVFCEPASVDFVAKLIALWSAGSTPVPLTATLTERELRFFNDHASGRSAEALLLYTSGSTGNPKGVRLSHKSVLSSIRTTTRHFGFGPDTRMLSVLDPSHGHGLIVTLLAPLVAGGTIVLDERFSAYSASHFWKSCEDYGVTCFSAVPAVLRSLERLTHERPECVQMALCASAPLPRTFHEHFERKFGLPLWNNYGMTETATWVTRGGRDGHVGRAEPDTLRISERGEVQIRCNQNTLGYLDNDAATKALFDDGWLRTGDLGRIEDGFLYLVGRAKEVIDRGAEKIYPAEVEERLLEHPGVRVAAVVGRPSARYGEEVYAFVVGDDADPRALREWCKEGLAPFKVPKRVQVLEDMPRLRTGKIDKNALKSGK